MFQSGLIVKKTPRTRFSYELSEPLIWQSYFATDRGLPIPYTIIVPKGFVCDFASVPWLFQRIYPKMGTLSDMPAVLHDWLYVTEMYDRKTCDEIFLEALLERGTAKWKAYSMYWAVRIGGKFVWDNHNPDEVISIRKQFGVYSEPK